jgi:hypothetical protein
MVSGKQVHSAHRGPPSARDLLRSGWRRRIYHSTVSLILCFLALQKRLWEHLDLTMRAAQSAEQALRTTNVSDEEAMERMTALIEDVTRKHDLLRTELPAYGFSVPHGHTASLTQALGKGQEGRKMAFERLLGDVKEACVEVLLQITCGSAVCSCSYLALHIRRFLFKSAAIEATLTEFCLCCCLHPYCFSAV